MAYSTINKHTDYFNTKTYSGTGSGQSITGVGFQPDFTWIKHREDVSNHRLFDAVRGANKNIKSNDTQSEITASNQLMSFDSDGFTLGDDGSVNGTGSAGVCSWNWKANGAGSANTDGSINSTVSVNTTAGFSIVKYTATGNVGTIGHGLNAVPKMLIFKDLEDTGGSDWYVHHTSTGVNGRLILNSNNAVANNTGFLNQVLPTSTLITLGTTSQVNNVGNDFICYAFAPKTGYSKFGSFIGNGQSGDNAPFIYTGFKPQLVIFKNSSITQHWTMMDTKRDPYNVMDTRLYPSQNNADTTNAAYYVDYLSNGFKIRTNSVSWNGDGNNIIYMAFGQSLVSSNNVPCTAR